MKKVFVIDWLDKFGGAERVISTIEKIVSFDKSFTLINTMKTEELRQIFPQKDSIIEETILKYTKNKFRLFFFTFHILIDRIKIDKDAQLIFSSSHAVAKGVRKSNINQLHISYFQARNFNYIWEDSKLFFGIFKPVFYPLIYILRKIDVKQAQRPDYIIANSLFVKKWIKEKYNRESTVIYPPVELQYFPLEIIKENYYIIVGRVVHVKKFDIVIKAFNDSGRKLIVIGDGSLLSTLKSTAAENIVFKGFLKAEEVSQYIQKAKGFIQMGVEAFGIATIEAQACGTPVIAYAEGGVLETVIDLQTGVFFKEQSVESLKNAILQFEKIKFYPVEVRNNALRFSKTKFEEQIRLYIKEKCDLHHLNCN
ncbi:glycosyltransferase [Flavobacterium antarcticum]|uniref:glycosyltransferase n=1 Tax=Flavobacterium antarcticum TaxID=271155 RepID=UPI0003B51B34|nr:glycosyltransferase [Flavobacterium antarcticum]